MLFYRLFPAIIVILLDWIKIGKNITDINTTYEHKKYKIISLKVSYKASIKYSLVKL